MGIYAEGGSQDQCVNAILAFDWRTSRTYQNPDMLVRRSAEIRTCNSRIGNQESLHVIIGKELTVLIQVCTLLAMYSWNA